MAVPIQSPVDYQQAIAEMRAITAGNLNEATEEQVARLQEITCVALLNIRRLPLRTQEAFFSLKGFLERKIHAFVGEEQPHYYTYLLKLHQPFFAAPREWDLFMEGGWAIFHSPQTELSECLERDFVPEVAAEEDPHPDESDGELLAALLARFAEAYLFQDLEEESVSYALFQLAVSRLQKDGGEFFDRLLAGPDEAAGASYLLGRAPMVGAIEAVGQFLDDFRHGTLRRPATSKEEREVLAALWGRFKEPVELDLIIVLQKVLTKLLAPQTAVTLLSALATPKFLTAVRRSSEPGQLEEVRSDKRFVERLHKAATHLAHQVVKLAELGKLSGAVVALLEKMGFLMSKSDASDVDLLFQRMFANPGIRPKLLLVEALLWSKEGAPTLRSRERDDEVLIRSLIDQVLTIAMEKLPQAGFLASAVLTPELLEPPLTNVITRLYGIAMTEEQMHILVYRYILPQLTQDFVGWRREPGGGGEGTSGSG